MPTEQVSKFRIATYGVLVRAGKVLLTETRVPHGMIINFPGGGLELGEAPVEAVKREFDEETGLSIRVVELLYATEGFFQNPHYPNEQLVHLFYRVEETGGELLPTGNGDDVAALHWFAPDELPLDRIEPIDRVFTASEAFRRLF